MQSFMMTGTVASRQCVGMIFVFVLFLVKGYEGQLTGHQFKKILVSGIETYFFIARLLCSPHPSSSRSD